MSGGHLPPLQLHPNPVWRSYRGGSALRAFRGQSGTKDDHFPEDWLASTVLARNGSHSQGPDEGVSWVDWNRRKMSVGELLGVEKERLWGKHRRKDAEASLGVLIKLLDAADRLQVQVHPNKQFVRQHLSGNFGKTECWYILSTRG